MNETLGKEYEEWLDSIEVTLPLAIPEEDNMSSNETKLADIQQIYKRLGSLEEQREHLRLTTDHEEVISLIDEEMQMLRSKLQEIMNGVCPLAIATKR